MDVVRYHIDMLRCGYRYSNNTIYVPSAIINANIEKPLLIAIIGKNGVGKSTLIRTLAGIQLPLEGNIFLNKKSIYKYSNKEKARYISYLPPQNPKIPYLTVKEFVKLGQPRSILQPVHNDDLVIEILSLLQLNQKAEHFLTQLSDGEMQRAAIAKIIFQNSTIMFFDEPLSHLDPKQQINILNLFYKLVHENNKIVFFSSHLTDLALKFAHKIWLITEDAFIEKIPEQIIIDKDLEKNELKIEVGEYLPVLSKTNRCVRIVGDGIPFKYTKYALLRYGIRSDCNKNAAFSVIIQQNLNGDYSWLLKKEHVVIKEFNKLEEIILYLIQEL